MRVSARRSFRGRSFLGRPGIPDAGAESERGLHVLLEQVPLGGQGLRRLSHAGEIVLARSVALGDGGARVARGQALGPRASEGQGAAREVENLVYPPALGMAEIPTRV